MSLLSRLRERQNGKVATATLATLATDEGVKGRSVATVATVAVANPAKEEKSQPDTETVSDWWLIFYPDRKSIQAAYAPALTRAEVMETFHPEAMTVVPFDPRVTPPTERLNADDERRIRDWLALIGETDAVAINGLIAQCDRDAESQAYFLARAAAELPKPEPDDRRSCASCANLSRQRCLAAMRGELPFAARTFEPTPDTPIRCRGYAPKADDPDQRSGIERWPTLAEPKAPEWA